MRCAASGALLGADVSALLDEAGVVADLLADDGEGNPALVLGAVLGGTRPLRDKVVFVDEGCGIVGFADWAEQLVAESTGKDGTGLLPVVVEEPSAPEIVSAADDALVVRLVPVQDAAEVADEAEAGAAPDGGSGAEVTVSGPLGRSSCSGSTRPRSPGGCWGSTRSTSPTSSVRRRPPAGCSTPSPSPRPRTWSTAWSRSAAPPACSTASRTSPARWRHCWARLSPNGYVGVMAYLDREHDAEVAALRPALAAHSGRPVTFGWGPRFLHSTGQFHKGGPACGVYLQVTGEPGADLPVPGRPFTFGQLISAQAAGDAQVLAEGGRPVLRLHLRNRTAGREQLTSAVGVTA